HNLTDPGLLCIRYSSALISLPGSNLISIPGSNLISFTLLQLWLRRVLSHLDVIRFSAHRAPYSPCSKTWLLPLLPVLSPLCLKTPPLH
ncbi:unnamed protein product, partial [Staurois parvus]